MRSTNKKGFTIVELVIVIAVIAILAAILVPTISNIVKRARVASDTQLVRNLNTSLAMDVKNPKHETMQSALDAAAAYGYDVAKINASAVDNMILWDSVNDVFCYRMIDDDGNIDISYIPNSVEDGKKLTKNDYRLWIISDTVSDTFSTYYTGSAATIDTTKGFDAGTTATVTAINYSNLGAAQNDVVIRTNSYETSLTISAPLDTVHHYGALSGARIEKISTASYYEHGDTNLVEIASGRLVITNDEKAKVDNVYLTATDDNYKVAEIGIIIATQTGAKLPDVIKRDAVTETDGKAVCVIQTNVDENGENPEKVDNVTIKGTDNVQEATNGYTNVADLTKMVLEAPVGSEIQGASDYIGNDVAVADEDKQGIINEAKGTVIEVTFRGEVSMHTISDFRDKWNSGVFYDTANPVSVRLTGNVEMKKIGNWGPIGTWEHPFFGTFDGQKSETENYVISNLSNHANSDADGNYTHVYSNGKSVGYGETYGFFGIIGGGNTTIQNVTFKEVDINVSNGANVGTVIGYAPALNKEFGGYSIAQVGDISLSNISVFGSVSAKSHVAGLAGDIRTSGALSITNCTNSANITATGARCGGIVATIQGPEETLIDGCTNKGSIISYTAGGTGGIVGGDTKANSITISNCYNKGQINNYSTGNGAQNKGFTGGIIGLCPNTMLTLDNCYNEADIITANNGAGGIVGGNNTTNFTVTLKGTISNTGNITADNYAGGIFGLICTKNGTTSPNPANITITELISIISDGDLTVAMGNDKTADYYNYENKDTSITVQVNDLPSIS